MQCTRPFTTPQTTLLIVQILDISKLLLDRSATETAVQCLQSTAIVLKLPNVVESQQQWMLCQTVGIVQWMSCQTVGIVCKHTEHWRGSCAMYCTHSNHDNKTMTKTNAYLAMDTLLPWITADRRLAAAALSTKHTVHHRKDEHKIQLQHLAAYMRGTHADKIHPIGQPVGSCKSGCQDNMKCCKCKSRSFMWRITI